LFGAFRPDRANCSWRLRQLGPPSRRQPIVGADLVGSEAH
jgi:hypothetical protein